MKMNLLADDDECLSVNSSILEDVVHASQLIGCLQQQFCWLKGSSNSEDKKTYNYHLKITINFYKIKANSMLFVYL